MIDKTAEKFYTNRIGVDHAEFCVHKIVHYQNTGKPLSCKDCPRTQCKFHGLSV